MSPLGSLFGAPPGPSPAEPAREPKPEAPEAEAAGDVEDQVPAAPAPGEEPPAPEPPAAAPAAAPVAADDAPGAGDADEYQVLALRYRPQTFADLVGQEAIARTLQNAIRKNRIWHAFLFAGPRGVGKTTTARILAKALNCAADEGPNPEPCGTCPSCREVAGGYSRDVPEIDGASNNSVEKAREIIETAHYTPSRDRYKIFLVDEVHMLSGGAFNALLKTLEEPPPHVKFIFATTEIHRIPDTILSRCQEFEFRAVTQRAVVERLQHIVDDQGFEVAPEALAQIARFGQGSLRDALSALDQVMAAVDGAVTAADVSEVIGVPDVQICRRAATAIVEGDRRAVFEIVEELVSEGRDLKHFVTLLMHYLRDLTVVRAAPDRPDLLEWPQEQERAGRVRRPLQRGGPAPQPRCPDEDRGGPALVPRAPVPPGDGAPEAGGDAAARRVRPAPREARPTGARAAGAGRRRQRPASRQTAVARPPARSARRAGGLRRQPSPRSGSAPDHQGVSGDVRRH